MALLTKDQIFAADDLRYENVDVPEWGGAVRVSVMTGAIRDKYEGSLYDIRSKIQTVDNLRARFLAHCVVDGDGKLLFSQKDILELGQKSSAALDRVFTVATKLNGTGVEGLEDAAADL